MRATWIFSTPPGCSGVINFVDPDIETAVRAAVGIPTAPLYYNDVRHVTTLEVLTHSVEDIAGVQCLVGLTELRLQQNKIADITELQYLPRLTYLNIHTNTELVDISPLSELGTLTFLSFGGCHVSDLSPLQNLTNLEVLSMSGQRLGALSDISVVRYLTKLTSLSLEYNHITDLGPIVQNTQISDGDRVAIEYNDYDCDDVGVISDIAILTNRGVDLSHDCD